MFLLRITALTVLVLTGCATPKPEMPEGMYQEAGRSLVAVHGCARVGYLSPDIAALGDTYLRSIVANHTYDALRLSAATEAAGAAPVTQAECNVLAMRIQGRKQQIARNNEAIRAEEAGWDRVNANRPRNTYCNKVGLQTFCNTN